MTTATDWRTGIGDVWAQEWRRIDRSLAALMPPIIDAVRDLASERARILDIGCGAGSTTLAAAHVRPAAAVLGVDLSPSLIEVARTRLASDRCGPAPKQVDDPGPVFEVGDALAVAADRAPFDLFLSRHGVMFFADPVAAFTALRAVADPDAALVFTCFGPREANGFATLADELRGIPPTDPDGTTPGPFAFADEARVAAILTEAGWYRPVATRIDFAYRAGDGEDPIADAVDFLSRIGPVASVLRDADPAARDPLRRRLADLLASYRAGDAVDLPARAWLWRAKAGESI